MPSGCLDGDQAERLDHLPHHGLALPAYGEHLVEARPGLPVPRDAVPARRLVPRQVERVPGRGVAQHHPADPRVAGEAEVAQRLDERPLVADGLVQLRLVEAAGALDRLGPAAFDDHPRLPEPLGGVRPHQRALRVATVELRLDQRGDVDVVDDNVLEVRVDVDVPDVHPAEPAVSDATTAHVRSAHDDVPQVGPGEVVLPALVHADHLGGFPDGRRPVRLVSGRVHEDAHEIHPYAVDPLSDSSSSY